MTSVHNPYIKNKNSRNARARKKPRRRKLRKGRIAFLLLAIAAVTLLACRLCGNDRSQTSGASQPLSDADAVLYAKIAANIPEKETLRRILRDEPHPIWDAKPGVAPDDSCVKLRINDPGYLFKEFRDSNYIQVEEARKYGIRPVENELDAYTQGKYMIKVNSCKDFYVDSLRHSVPYLVPEAYRLLHEIASAWTDSLKARGGGDYRLKVTSLTRTASSVRRLRRVNRNSVGESAHQYGTTFDISYAKFIYDGHGTRRTFEDLKNLLGEIMHIFRDRGLCYVTFERRQACFHVTARLHPELSQTVPSGK